MTPPFFCLTSLTIHIILTRQKGGECVAEAKTTVLTIREWPVDLHRQMRSEAAIRGITLREAIMEAARL